MRTTLGDAKSNRISRLPQAINIRPDDLRFLSYVNEATLRLMHKGKWWGTFGRFSISISSQILTLPPVLDTIELINVAKCPVPLRSRWFEFLSNGYGTRNNTLPNGSGLNECLEQNASPTIVAIASPYTVLTAKCDVASDVGRKVRILGYDANGNWVRTLVAGIWYDGEEVALAQGAGTATTTVFSSITDIKPPTDLDGQWWLYQGTIAGTLLGQYQYWETAPMYRQYLVPFVNPTISTIEVMGKLAFRPVFKDTDYLIIGNLPALKLGMMACKAEEEHAWGEAQFLWNGGKMKDGTVRVGAVQELDAELAHYNGDGQQLGINLVNTNAGFGEPVETLV